jgi:hypothetical protein
MDTTNWKSELAANAKMKILIVEDEHSNVEHMEDMLGKRLHPPQVNISATS